MEKKPVNTTGPSYQMEQTYLVADGISRIEKKIQDMGDRLEPDFLAYAKRANFVTKEVYMPVYDVICIGEYSKDHQKDSVRYALNSGTLFGYELDISSYTPGRPKQNKMQPITEAAAHKLPLLNRLLTEDEIAACTQAQADKKRGKFIQESNILSLVLVPVLKVVCTHNNINYAFFCNLCDGTVDIHLAPLKPKITQKFEWLKKYKNITNIIKIALAVLWIPCVIFFFSATHDVVNTVAYTLIQGLLLILPWHFRKRQWTKICQYRYSNKYISNKGKFTIKAIIYQLRAALQILISAYLCIAALLDPFWH